MRVLIADVSPSVRAVLRRILAGEAGFEVVTVPVSQAALLDGGLSCQSLRF